MRFSTRVQVHSADGLRISSIPGEQAAKQVASCLADPRGGGATVRAIKLRAASPAVIGACRDLSVSAYMGTRYTHKEAVKNRAGDVIGYQHELNRLNSLDRELFCLSVTDNLVERAA